MNGSVKFHVSAPTGSDANGTRGFYRFSLPHTPLHPLYAPLAPIPAPTRWLGTGMVLKRIKKDLWSPIPALAIRPSGIAV